MILRASKATEKQEINADFDEAKEIYLFPIFQPVFNSTSNLDTTRISSCYGCRYQAVNLVDLLIHSSNIIDSTHSCRNSSNHLDTKRISNMFCLHNLSYVILFFVISFTNGIFDAFNCWNHCIFQVLCVRHWHIFSCATTDWCIQIVKCF